MINTDKRSVIEIKAELLVFCEVPAGSSFPDFADLRRFQRISVFRKLFRMIVRCRKAAQRGKHFIDRHEDLRKAALTDNRCDLVKRAPKDFALYTGDDATAMAFMLCGGHGVISVTANVAPRQMAELCRAAIAGDVQAARRINDPLQGLHKDLFCEANPIPVKWAVHQLGLMPNGIRLPLTTLSEASQPRVLAALRQAGLIA